MSGGLCASEHLLSALGCVSMVVLSWAAVAVCIAVRWFNFLDVVAEGGCVALCLCVCVCVCVCLGLWKYWDESGCAHTGYVCVQVRVGWDMKVSTCVAVRCR